jgi:hypothetical protein
MKARLFRARYILRIRFKSLPEHPRRNDLKFFNLAQLEQLLVSRNKDISLSAHCTGQDQHIILVADFDVRQGGGAGKERILFEGFEQFSNQINWYTEFFEENPLQLNKQRLRDNQLVRSKHCPQHIRAKAPGSGCAYQDICVKKHLHDMREKTSSSVKNPRASAKGIIFFLNSSNCWRRSWRRKASRAISLRFLPDRLLALDSKLSRSLSNRIVKVAVFMCYNVRRLQSFVKVNWVLLRKFATVTRYPKCSVFCRLCKARAKSYRAAERFISLMT